MRLPTLLTLLAPLLPLAASQSQSFYAFSLYTNPACSVFVGGIDGATAKNCTSLLPTTNTTTSSYNTSSAPTIFMQSDGFIGTCQISLYSDESCVDQVSGTTSPPNLGCVSTAGAMYYEVFGC